MGHERRPLSVERCSSISAMPHSRPKLCGGAKSRDGPTHKVAALQPAVREQEPRGREPVERTVIAGKVNTTNQHSVGVQHIARAGQHPRAASHIIGRTDNAMIKNCLDESANQFA